MPDLPLSVCFWDYDRTRPLIDGRVAIRGVRPSFTVLNPVDAFAKAFTTAEFDVSELSFSNHMTAFSKGRAAYTLIPVFLSRAFRQSILYVRADRGIDSPADLAGKTVGTTEYDMTASLVVRGFLRDEHGLKPSDMAWRIGDLDAPERERIPVPDVPGVDIRALAPGQTLDGELATGTLDALIVLRPPRSFLSGDGRVRRLFPDWRREEKAYYARSGIFPIMHAVGIRTTLLARHPWLARALFDAFDAAKRSAIAELSVVQAPKVTLPWVAAELDATRAAMGEDFWPYGVERNRRTLEALIRYSFDEGLSARRLSVEELFAADTLDL